MEKAHGLRQPSPPMKPRGRKRAVPPRGAFSAQMLRPPSTPTDSSLPDEFHPEVNDYAFVTSRRGSSEVDNQALSPPPPPPPYHPSTAFRRPITTKTSVTSHSSSVKGIPTGAKAVSPKALSNNDEVRKRSTDKPMPSVHPIDTLSKKLRQQAMELTHVYEELEKQNMEIDAYKQQIEDQRLQLEKLREKRRKSIDGSSKPSTSLRKAALEQQKRAAQMMIGTPCTGASLGQKRDALDHKLKEAEREKKKYQLAAKRIEKALVELQVFQNDRMGKLLPHEGDSNHDEKSDFQAVLDEQRAYIRVLEEAVHLKATDFEITGHEELLVVLAELRHTIYEQEKDVQEKTNLLASIQQQIKEVQQQHLETKNTLEMRQNQHEEMKSRLQEQEAVFHDRIDKMKLQLLEREGHLNQLQNTSIDAKRTEENLQNRLAAATKSQNLTETKLEDAARNIKVLQEQLHESTIKYDEAKHQMENLREECAKKQGHLDEMNALQEELLGSVDKYVGKVKKLRDKVERLEAELESCKEKELLAQNQQKEAARLSDERVSALQAAVDAVEHRTQQLQAQCTAFEQEKNRLEDALAEAQQQLERQEQQSIDQLQEMAAKEHKFYQMEEAAAELEAALSTVSLMISRRTPESDQQCLTQEDEHAFLLDQFVLRELETCCQALNTLTRDNGPTQRTSLCSSFSEIVAIVAAIGQRVLEEVNRALASWARERTNLVEACATLDATAKMCQNEMEKRHDEIRDYRKQLTERVSEVEAFVIQLETLHEQLGSAQAECEAFHAFEAHAAHQEEALQAKQALISDLSAENDRLSAVENAYSIQLATNARYSQRLEDQQEAINEQKQYAQELEQALENAAIFAEQQNECTQQLQTQLAEMETSHRVQADQVKTLEVHASAFSSQFKRLVKQYTNFLHPIAATNRSLQGHLNVFDTEFQNGDILRLLQLFPALLKEYISSCTSNSIQGLPIDPTRSNKSGIITNATKKKPQVLSPYKPRNDNLHVEISTPKTQSPISEPTASTRPVALNATVTKSSLYSIAAEKEEDRLAEQLDLIRGAFESYKDHDETGSYYF